ncbi:MAG: YfhO family protein, partial [Thermoanaerobaculia bacterium]
AFGLVTMYVLFYLMDADSSRRVEAGKRFAAAVAMSLGMAAFLYVPAVMVLQFAPHSAQRYHDAAQIFLSPYTLMQLLSPTATGGSRIYEKAVMDDSYHQLFYTGAFALLLALVGAARGKSVSKPLWMACVVCTLLTLAKLFGAPPVDWIAYLPGFRTVHFAVYFGTFLDFLLALLAGLGMDRLLRRDVTDRSIVTAIASITALVIGVWSLSRMEQVSLKPDSWRWLADLQVVIIFGAAGALLLLVMRTTRRDRVRYAAGFAFLAGIFIEGVTNTTFPRQNRFDVFANLPPYVKMMKQLPDTGRFFTSKVLEPNLGSGTGIRQVESIYNFQSSRLFEVYRTYTVPPEAVVWHFLRDATELPPEPVLDRMNVGYVAVRPSAAVSQKIDDTSQTRGYPVAWQDSYARIYSRKTLPRAQFSSSYQIADRAGALRLIGSAPGDRVILETRPGFPSAANLPDDPQPRIVRALRNRLTIDVQSPRPGLLYLADTWFPGWTATVNGRTTPILIANYAFRAVEIPAGATAVELKYWPVGMTPGLAISAISLMLCALCLFIREPRSGAPDAASVDDALPAV